MHLTNESVKNCAGKLVKERVLVTFIIKCIIRKLNICNINLLPKYMGAVIPCFIFEAKVSKAVIFILASPLSMSLTQYKCAYSAS